MSRQAVRNHIFVLVACILGCAPETLGYTNLRHRRGKLTDRIDDHDVVSIDIESLLNGHQRSRRSAGAESLDINFQAYDKDFNMKLFHADAHFADGFRVDFHTKDGVENIQVDKSSWFRGRLFGHGTADSDVRAHVTQDGLVATIRVQGEMFRLEPWSARKHGKHGAKLSAWDEYRGFNHVIFAHSHTKSDPRAPSTCGIEHPTTGDDRNDDVKNSTTTHHTSKYMNPELQVAKAFEESTKYAGESSRSRRNINFEVQHTCAMSLVADEFFFESEGESDVVTTTNRLIEVLEDANAIYFSTQFDGDDLQSVKFQLAVKKITIFGTGSDSEQSPWTTVPTNDATIYLDEFSGTKNDPPLQHDQFCLAHAFTRQDFNGGTLGLAWLGTVCQNSQNTGITTTINFGSDIPYTQFMLVFSHEVGHNWGMQHDTGCGEYCAINGFDCEPDAVTLSDVAGGKFIMWPTSVDGSSANNDAFSVCSRYNGGKTLENGGASCFEDIGNAICGNGIVQGDEECDCGVTAASGNQSIYTPEEIFFCQSNTSNTNRDFCCLPDCTLDRTRAETNADPAECSPQKGVCCGDSGNEECKLLGLDPNTDLKTGTLEPVDAASAESFKCASSTGCTIDSYCIRDSTYAGVCPTLALKGTAQESLLQKEDNTLCNDDRNTCQQGECVGSLCKAYQSPGSSFEPTSCSSDDAPCDISCIFVDGGDCISTRELASHPELNLTGDDYPQGSLKAPGQGCKDLAGFCDENGDCVEPSNDSPLDLLTDVNIEWVWENWYVVLIIETIILGLAFLLRCTSSKKKKETKSFVRQRLKMEDRDVQKRAGLLHETKGRLTTRNSTRGTKGATWQELAVLKAQAAGQRRKSEILFENRQKGLAFFRLKTLFPDAKWNVIRQMVALSPHEEAAVARMLVLGYQMWLVPDYKQLNFAAKRFRKKAEQHANNNPQARRPGHALVGASAAPKHNGKQMRANARAPQRAGQPNPRKAKPAGGRRAPPKAKAPQKAQQQRRPQQARPAGGRAQQPKAGGRAQQPKQKQQQRRPQQQQQQRRQGGGGRGPTQTAPPRRSID